MPPFDEDLPAALPYLPPSQPPKPMVIESRMPSERYRPSVEHRRREHRNRVRTWLILGGGLALGTVLILLKL